MSRRKRSSPSANAGTLSRASSQEAQSQDSTARLSPRSERLIAKEARAFFERLLPPTSISEVIKGAWGRSLYGIGLGSVAALFVPRWLPALMSLGGWPLPAQPETLRFWAFSCLLVPIAAHLGTRVLWFMGDHRSNVRRLAEAELATYLALAPGLRAVMGCPGIVEPEQVASWNAVLDSGKLRIETKLERSIEDVGIPSPESPATNP
jgi:hypothetical protein